MERQAIPVAVKVAFVGAVGMIGGAFVPWAKLTVTILGAESPALTVKGTDIGSDLGGTPWAWFLIGAGVAGLIGLANARLGFAALAGMAGAAFAVVNLSTLNASHVSAQTSVDGQVLGELNPHVSPAWGSWLVLAASVVLALGSLAAARERTGPEAPLSHPGHAA